MAGDFQSVSIITRNIIHHARYSELIHFSIGQLHLENQRSFKQLFYLYILKKCAGYQYLSSKNTCTKLNYK